MPEAACLHIQDREADPGRVVELHGGPVRIGRSAFCDIRLADPTLARVECQLSPADGGWQLVPERATASVWLDGAPLDGPRPLALDEPFRVGSHWLTLRPLDPSLVTADEPAPDPVPAPDWVASPLPDDADPTPSAEPPVLEVARAEPLPWVEPSPQAESSPPVAGLGVSAEPETAAPESGPSHREEWASRSDKHDRLLQARREAKRWETRWRAVGEKLRDGAPTPPVAPPTAPRSPVAPAAHRPLPARPERGAYPTYQAAAPAPSVPLARPQPRPLVPSGYPRTAPPVPPARPEARYVPPVPPVEVERPEPGPRASVANPEPADVAATIEHPAVETVPVTEARVVSRHEWDDETADEAQAPPERLLGTTRRLEPPVAAAPAPVDDRAPEFQVIDVESWAVAEDAPHGATVAVAEDRSEVVADAVPAAPPFAFATADQAHEAAAVEPGRSVPAVEVASEAPPEADPVEALTRDASPAVEHWEPRPRRPAADPAQEGPRDRESARDWPRVSDILAAQGPRPGPRPAPAVGQARRPTARPRPVPTEAREPRGWAVPLWLGWLPASALTLTLAVAGLGLGWVWTIDAYHAALVARRSDPALAGASRALPKGVEPGPASWWRTTPEHLMAWVTYLDRSNDDPAQATEARRLLRALTSIAPLSPPGRYALAQGLGGGDAVAPELALARSLGQSRDVVALAAAGGALLRAGKTEAALGAYRSALALAAAAELDRPSAPILDGSQARRVGLPSEDLLAAVVRDMAGHASWSYKKQWGAALPTGTAAPLVAARVLRDLQSPDADAALDRALAVAGKGVPAPAPVPARLFGEGRRGLASAVALAARAEALALKDRFKEALEQYHAAIEAMPVDVVRRSWWLNLADVARRANDDAERQKALELAKSEEPKDEITRLAIELQKDAGLVARRAVARATTDPEAKAASRP